MQVRVGSGTRDLALDWLDGDGTWHEFFRAPLDTSALPPTRAPRRQLRSALVYETLQHLYRHSHRASFRRVCAEADRVLEEVLTFTTDVPLAEGFHGFIENPGFWLQAQYDKFRITGWTFAIGRDIQVGQWADLRLVQAGEACPKCGKPLKVQRAIEVGHVFNRNFNTELEQLGGAGVDDGDGAVAYRLG